MWTPSVAWLVLFECIIFRAPHVFVFPIWTALFIPSLVIIIIIVSTVIVFVVDVRWLFSTLLLARPSYKLGSSTTPASIDLVTSLRDAECQTSASIPKYGGEMTAGSEAKVRPSQNAASEVLRIRMEQRLSRSNSQRYI